MKKQSKMPEWLKVYDDSEVQWVCRFHPEDYFHEVGCPHQKWTKKELQEALEHKKKFEDLCIRKGANKYKEAVGPSLYPEKDCHHKEIRNHGSLCLLEKYKRRKIKHE